MTETLPPVGSHVTFDVGAQWGFDIGTVLDCRVIRHFKNGTIQIEVIATNGKWGAGKNLNVKPSAVTLK